ncbi:MAG: three-Cys-motif partner protein TcmP [Bacteroidales bacterium]|nr:three-Cys-motif partner protein TcmP [Bacteroidales bacterium]
MRNNYEENGLDSLTVSENKCTWGGPWTQTKLETFEKYVNAYLTIMNKHRDKYDWKLIYFDGFAGSGTRDQEKENPSELLKDLFHEGLDKEDLSVYKGAAERVLSIKQRGFDDYYFIDSNKAASDKLKEKLKDFESPDRKMFFINKDANEAISNFADKLDKHRNYTSLVLLDPFGMQLDWDSIKRLARPHTDLWILIPTGVIVNRLLDKKGELMYENKLKSFFGLSMEQIKAYFYQRTNDQTLFGEEERIIKVQKPIERIAELYIERLKELFSEVSDKPLVMYNSCNTPIFHFVFASNNQTAKNIAQDIVGKMKRRKN